MSEPKADSGAAVPRISLLGEIDPSAPDWHYVQQSSQDDLVGRAIAWHAGDTFIHQRMPPQDQWARIARILRVHGVKFSFKPNTKDQQP